MFNFIKNLIDKLQWWRVECVLKAYQENLSFYKNVWAVGKGYRFRNGKQTKEKCIICFVDKKLPETQLLTEEKLPRKIRGLFGCRVDVISLNGKIETTNIHRTKMRPAKGGISISHPMITAGTLGAKVWDKDTGQPYILSNAHVVFPFYLGAKIGDEAWQPGRIDRGSNKDKIGILEKYAPIKPLPVKNNLADAALVKIEDKDVLNEQIGLGKMGIKVVRVKINDELIKSSRTSGVNEGRVIATNVLSRVRFNWRDSEGKIIKRIIYFTDQVFTSQNPNPFVRGGDSGSVVYLKKTKQPCALIFAGSPRVGVMNNLDNVCKFLNITFEPPKKLKTGWVALGRWLSFYGLKITTKSRTNFRSSAGIRKDNIIQVLPARTKLKIQGETKLADGFLWVKVRCG